MKKAVHILYSKETSESNHIRKFKIHSLDNITILHKASVRAESP